MKDANYFKEQSNLAKAKNLAAFQYDNRELLTQVEQYIDECSNRGEISCVVKYNDFGIDIQLQDYLKFYGFKVKVNKTAVFGKFNYSLNIDWS